MASRSGFFRFATLHQFGPILFEICRKPFDIDVSALKSRLLDIASLIPVPRRFLVASRGEVVAFGSVTVLCAPLAHSELDPTHGLKCGRGGI